MYENLVRAAGRVREPKEHPIDFGPFHGGMVTARPPHMLARSECVEMADMVIGPDGIPRTRPGLTLIGEAASASHIVNSVKDIRVGGTWYRIASTTNGSSYQLHAYNAVSGVFEDQIGNDTMFDGEISFTGFNDLLLIFDGGYVKYWDGTNVYLSEDQGTGAKASPLVENYNGEGRTKLPLTYLKYDLLDTDYTKFGVKFTTPATGTDFDVPVITFALQMAKVGTGASAAGISGEEFVQVSIRNATSPYASLGSKDLVFPANLPAVDATPLAGTDPTAYDMVEGSFIASELTAGLDPSTEYMLCVEYDYSDGAGGNYPSILGCYVDASTSPLMKYLDSTTTWSAITWANFMIDIDCGTPPKLKYGVEHNERVFGIEGMDGTNPDYVWYCGAGNHLDWSSENYAGYLTAGFPANAVASFYDNLFLFGSEKKPGLKRMTGATPATYALSDSIQAVSANQKAMVVTPNDLMFLHPSGVSSIQTIQQYGDIRASSRSDNILPEILASYDSSALAAYEPRYGLYLLKLNDSNDSTLYAVHTKSGSRQYQIAKWTLASGETISSIDNGENSVYVNTEEGNIYEIDYTTLKDNGTYPTTYAIKSRVFLSQHMNLTAARYYAMLSSKGNGGSVDFKLYRNQSSTALQTETIALPTDLSGAQPDSSSAYLRAFGRQRLNFDFWALQVSYENIVPVNDNPIYFGGVQVLAR